MTLWWKCHDDILRHPKTRRLPPLHKVVLWAAFNTASRSPKRGVLYISQGVPAEPFDLADEAGVSIEDALAAIGSPEQRGTLTTKGAQAEKGIWLDWTDDGVLYFPEWKERQYEADATNATRQKRHREKQKLTNKPPPVTESNALRNVTVTPPDNRLQSTDKTNEEKEEEEGNGVRNLPDELRDNWLKAYEFWFLGMPASTWISAYTTLQQKGGITDRLIVAVIEKAISGKKPNLMKWSHTVLRELAPYEIRTVAEWLAFEAERQTEQAEVNSNGRTATGSTGTTPGEASGAGPGRAGPNARGGERQGSADEGFGFNSLTHRGGTGEPDVS